MADRIAPARDVLYLGRGLDYPLALEGALKLKEISYIHAEGYAAGEMKHGPIALIDDAVPVIILAPSGPLFEKTVSNMQEVRARGGKIVLISDRAGLEEAGRGLPRDNRDASGPSAHRTARLRRPGAIACLSRGLPERHRRRSAAQLGQKRNGGIGPGYLAPGKTRLSANFSRSVYALLSISPVCMRHDTRSCCRCKPGTNPAYIISSRWAQCCMPAVRRRPAGNNRSAGDRRIDRRSLALCASTQADRAAGVVGWP